MKTLIVLLLLLHHVAAHSQKINMADLNTVLDVVAGTTANDYNQLLSKAKAKLPTATQWSNYKFSSQNGNYAYGYHVNTQTVFIFSLNKSGALAAFEKYIRSIRDKTPIDVGAKLTISI